MMRYLKFLVVPLITAFTIGVGYASSPPKIKDHPVVKKMDKEIKTGYALVSEKQEIVLPEQPGIAFRAQRSYNTVVLLNYKDPVVTIKRTYRYLRWCRA